MADITHIDRDRLIEALDRLSQDIRAPDEEREYLLLEGLRLLEKIDGGAELYVPADDTPAAKEGGEEDTARIREMWAAVARHRWVLAAEAGARRDWLAMRSLAALAKEAEEDASLHGAFARAVFGGKLTPPDAAALEAARAVDPERAKLARQAVLAEMARHEEARQARLRAQIDARKAKERALREERARFLAEERARREAEMAAAREALPVGTVARVERAGKRGGNRAGQVQVLVDGHEHWIWAGTDRFGATAVRPGEWVEITHVTPSGQPACKAVPAHAQPKPKPAIIPEADGIIVAAFDALATKVAGVVVERPTTEDVVGAPSGAVLGAVLAEDGSVYGIKAIDLKIAITGEIRRDDWPFYLASRCSARKGER
jgi:hypothetical protein